MSSEDDDFFNESRDQSKVKTAIVGKYFYAWAKIIIPKSRTDKVGYIDLFCGPGLFEDGTPSTPIKIIERAIRNEDMRGKVMSIFNDANTEHVESLKGNLNKLEGIKSLKYPPKYLNGEVEEEMTQMFNKISLIPSLVFLDPFGYKSLSIDLISGLFKDWGCDAIFFFNYNRVNMGVNNPFMQNNMERLFGKEILERLKLKLNSEDITPTQREKYILLGLQYTLRKKGGEYFLPFKFRKGKKTSHFIIFVSKNILGYSVMKKIMANEGHIDKEGVPSFEFDCDPPKEETIIQMSLFPPKIESKLDKLKLMLLEDFKGKSLTVRNLIDNHHVGKPYIDKNYKDALRSLEEKGEIKCNPEYSKRRFQNGVKTLGNKVIITFN